MASGIDLRGTADLRRAAESAAREVGDLDAAHNRAADVVGPDARDATPRATGATAATVAWGVGSSGPEVTVGADHAVPLHFGAPAIGRPARPWVADTFKAREDDIVRVYEQHLDDVVDEFNH